MAVRLTLLLFAGLLSFGTGFVVTRMGRPLHTGPFTLHKLAALAGIVVVVLALLAAVRGAAETALSLRILLYAATFLFAVLLVTGGLLSFDQFDLRWLVALHTVASILTVLVVIGLWVLRTK